MFNNIQSEISKIAKNEEITQEGHNKVKTFSDVPRYFLQIFINFEIFTDIYYFEQRKSWFFPENKCQNS